eukprot:TRINITY_DN1887_c0_g1_i3.p1 TRINITY_DN1887_c0_g1~~TRINITY_DN1887_c0_g1_i3.p1  ORF type:complete len:893 (+),score=172.44 TRINITY_DN1887_c0_g1_i3:88-2766(+)
MAVAISEYESWSESQIEDKLQEVLDSIQKVLLDSESDHEMRLYCVGFAAERIVQLVPVYEAEDSLYFPLLSGVKEFLEQVFAWALSEEPEERIMLLSIARALLDHTNTLLQYSAKYDGLGPGVIPSIPRVIPKIIQAVFNFCHNELPETKSDVAKESMSLMYTRGKNLLETLLSLVENMSVHPHLEDEIAILVELMDDLTNFHEALYAIDLKACMSVWNFYTKLATDFAQHLRFSLRVENALLILQRAAIEKFQNLIARNSSNQPSKKLNKMIVAISFLVKTIHTLANLYKNSLKAEFDTFIEFLSIFYNKEDNLKKFGDKSICEKLERDLFAANPPELFLLSVPDHCKLATALTSIQPNCDTVLSIVLTATYLLEVDSLEDEEKVKLVGTVLENLWMVEGNNLCQDNLESVQVEGSSVQLIAIYEWILTRICRVISILSPEDFQALETTLFQRYSSTENMFTRQMVSDIFCFIARYGSSSLCYSLLMTVCQVYLQSMDNTPNGAVTEVLIRRLFNFLDGEEKLTWIEEFVLDKPDNIVLWSCIEIDEMNTSLLTKIENALEKVYNEAFERDDYIHTLTCLIDCHTGVLVNQHSKTQLTNRMCLEIWQRLAENLYSPPHNYQTSQFLRALCDVTCSLLTSSQLATEDLSQVINWITCVINAEKSTEGNHGFSSGLMINMLKVIPTQSWIGNVENVDPCLVTQIGTLSSVCLRSAVKDPILKTPGLEYLRNLAQASNNSGLVRLCSDENDIMDHFTIFLKEEEDSTSNCREEKLTINHDAPPLFSILLHDDSEFETATAVGGICGVSSQQQLHDLDLKRKLSPGKSMMKTKRSKSGISCADEVDTVVTLLAKMEQHVTKLETLETGNLSDDQRTALRSLGGRLLKLIQSKGED